MLYALHRMGYHDRQPTHGLPRCAPTILYENGKFEPDRIETQLAHADDDMVRGAYTVCDLSLKHRAARRSGGLISDRLPNASLSDI